MSDEKIQGLLILPHLRVQNANAISSPLTHGFPAMTAFLGLMWALDRKLAEADIPLVPKKVGVICHDHDEQVQGEYLKTFCLTRNPVDKKGETAAIVEEGRIHLEITLIFEVEGGELDSGNNVLFQSDEAVRRDLAWRIRDLFDTMRIAGGTILPSTHMLGKYSSPALVPWPEQYADQKQRFRLLRRAWLPGFALVKRDDLLQQRLRELRGTDSEANLLDALLDLSRFNYRSHLDQAQETVVWKHDRERGSGWMVPIPIGYAGLSPLYDAGQVVNARDTQTPFRFVETIYSMGQWISPHRIQKVEDMLWWGDTIPEHSLYLCRNDYAPPAAEGLSSSTVSAANL